MKRWNLRRGQSSVEYLFVVALSLMLIVPASFLFFSYSKNSEDAVIAAQVNRVGAEILGKAEELYIVGENSWMTLEVTLPDNVESATIYGEGELVLAYYTQSADSDAVFFSDVPITNGSVKNGACLTNCAVDLIPGRNLVKITSRGDYVSIERS